MPLSWNEIKARAQAFAKEWENETREEAEAKSFWDGFFHVFGISRRRVATFETPVRKADAQKGYIDLLWKGVILVEHKSRGKDLDRAVQQAKDYFPGLKEHELPRYILVSDFQRFRLYDLDTDEQHEFELSDLPNRVYLFGFIAGYEQRTYQEEDPVNLKAAELMGRLHDRLEDIGYTGHALERYLVRLLFCLFADDAGIFEKGAFQQYLDLRTQPDGSDLAAHLALIFDTLNTPPKKRLKTLDENLAAFPYVNGKLFEETLRPAAFDRKMRDMLLEACSLDWGSISPAIFGSMFQAVMDPKERRNLGAHYTSERNILKVIRPLFLDDLYAELEKARGNRNRLLDLHRKIASLRFLDPACGCGNFLIIAYRELRLLEIRILRELYPNGQGVLDIRELVRVNVDQFAGIEIDEFAVRVAEVAMWLIDHQMNMKVSQEFGQYFVRLPLEKSARIVHGNALRLDWHEVFEAPVQDIYAENVNIIEVEEPAAHYQTVNVFTKNVAVFSAENAPVASAAANGGAFFDYIMGNPPFVGARMMSEAQRADLLYIAPKLEGLGLLDYVCGWYLKAAQHIQNTRTKVAFVSTNSITQGEQVGALWNVLLHYYHVKIHFAHRTFRWSNEARGNAAVFCVIIGFAHFDVPNKRLYEYEHLSGGPQEVKAQNINPYLVDAGDALLTRRQKPLCDVPEIGIGNKPIDGGHYLFTTEEKDAFLAKEPRALPYIRRWLGADEFINGWERWCLWLGECPPEVLRSMPEVMKRVEAVRQYRLSSVSAPTRKLADTPTRFHVENMPQESFLVIPETSSERRRYIPIGFLAPDTLVSNAIKIIPSASLYLFGILTSAMHMDWVRQVAGRLKSDYRYSKDIVYNNFPFPPTLTEAQRRKVETAAQAVLDVRARYPNSSLADLYDPITMPADLAKAHATLDKAVDLCYRPQPFPNERSRVEYLFALYEQYTAPMFGEDKPKSRTKSS